MHLNDFDAQEKIINEQEGRVRSEIEKLNELHKFRRPELVEKNYLFATTKGSISLSELFAEKDELILVHNMGAKCNYCTLWADGFQGYYRHIQTRAAFVLVNHDEPSAQIDFAASRGWQFPLVSAKDSSFSKDMGFYSEEKKTVWPGATFFKKEADGSIYRTTRVGFGPGDLFSSIWHLFALLPKGVNEWQPKR